MTRLRPRSVTSLVAYAAAPTDSVTHHYVATEKAAALLAGGCACGEGPEPSSAFAVDVSSPPSTLRWEGPICFENQMTGDGRLIEPNALRWEDLPLPLRHVSSDVGAHDGAVVVGRILTIERRRGGVIWASGDLDAESTFGTEAARQIERELKNGVSVDLDDVSFEIRVAKELLDDLDAPLLEEAKEQEVDAEGRVTVLDIDSDSEVMVTTSARIRAATLVDIPAFASARIHMTTEAPQTAVEEEQDSQDAGAVVVSLAASGAGGPAEPPLEWFSNPRLTEPTPLVVTPEGRVFGHIAAWGTCHTAFPGQCIEPPRSRSGYAYFHTGAVLTAEGTEVAVGRITIDTLHADKTLSATATLAHYENTGRAAAYVVAGEDEFGIWVAGTVPTFVSAEKVRALRASPVSGDWRRIGGHMELVGVLGVNVPGFPIPRPQGLVASGVMTSLVASGMLAPHKVLPPGSPGALSTDDLRYLKRLAQREREEEAREVTSAATALADRVRRTKIEAMARRMSLPVA